MKSLIALTIGILLLGSMSALYSGENITYTNDQLGLINITDMVISSNTSLILYEFNNTNAIVQIPKDSLQQTFTITFYGSKEEVIIPRRTYHSGATIIVKPSIESPTIPNETTQTIQTNKTNDTIEIPEIITQEKQSIFIRISDLIKRFFEWLRSWND